MRVQPALLILGLGACAALAACSDPAKQASKKAPDEEAEGDKDEAKSSNANFKASEDDSKVFETWCKEAALIAPVKKQLAAYFEQLCDGGKPQSLFTSKLIKAAYTGSGKVALSSIEKLASDKEEKTTTAYYGLAIKLPIAIKTHFEKVGPNGGDEEALVELAKAQGADATVEVQESFEKEGKFHVRGWKVHAINVKPVTDKIKVTTEAVTRADQFELEAGKAYAYTQYIDTEGKGLKTLDLLTAGVQVGGAGYLVTITRLTVDNKGIPAVAESTVKGLVESTAKAQYKIATQYKGQDEKTSSKESATSKDKAEDKSSADKSAADDAAEAGS